MIEGGPDSFLARKPRGVGLCEELGLAGRLIARQTRDSRTYVRLGDDLHPLPAGLTGMIPTRLDALGIERDPLARGPRPVRERAAGAGRARRPRRVDRRVRHAPDGPRGVRAPGRAADERHLRRRRRAAQPRGHIPESPSARAGARERHARAPRGQRRGRRRRPAVPVAARRDGRADGRRRRPPHRDDDRHRPDGHVAPPRLVRHRLRAAARGRRLARGGGRGPGDAGVRDGGADRVARPGARDGARGDPVRVVRAGHARLSRGGPVARSRRLWLRRPPDRGLRRPGVHLDVEQVGAASARRRRHSCASTSVGSGAAT